VLGRIRHFCDEKRISLTALECMGTRWTVRHGGAVWLAWATSAQLNGTRVVTAVKSRELGSGARSAEPGSDFVEPQILGNPQAPSWYLFEGESDAARGLELVSGRAAVMVLPAGALSFRREWAEMIPRGATVYLCHDADEAGDRGAAKAAKVIAAELYDCVRRWRAVTGATGRASASSSPSSSRRPVAARRCSRYGARALYARCRIRWKKSDCSVRCFCAAAARAWRSHRRGQDIDGAANRPCADDERSVSRLARQRWPRCTAASRCLG
jgi:hypothetical protein